MANEKSPGEIFIVDNSDDTWKVGSYLHDWCGLSHRIDIATGYFEIGSMLALKGEWRKVDRIRILMGDEVSLRTSKAFQAGLTKLQKQLDDSVEAEKEKNDFLTGVPAIIDAIASGKINVRVYRKDKFHAKAYITYSRQAVVGSFALVGSSNFTFPGLHQNVELNVQIKGAEVRLLQDWYERHWDDAEDVSNEMLNVIERHTREYSPFEIYAKALYELFRGGEETVTDWEKSQSAIYPILAGYQREGYHDLLKKAHQWNGAFLCDGVGLGKTYVGLMLIERLVVYEHKRVALFVPKSGREPVWEAALKQRLPDIFEGFYSFKIFNHTDLLRASKWNEMKQVRQQADVIIIDEAHHFRNRGLRGETAVERLSRYWKMFDLCEGKQVYLLTATPINNRLTDFQHMVELFSREQSDYFRRAPLGIHSLPGHIRALEKHIEKSASQQGESESIQPELTHTDEALETDCLFKALVVQRSRSLVKESLRREDDGQILFPKPREPKVVDYSVKQTYGKLLGMIEKAFNKREPLFFLSAYYPYGHFTGDPDTVEPFEKGRLKVLANLIRVGVLKRFESSVKAFEDSCWKLMFKLLAWVEAHADTEHEKVRLHRTKMKHDSLLNYTNTRLEDLFDPDNDDTEEDSEVVPQDMIEAVEQLNRENFNITEIINETLEDIDQLAEFLEELQQFKPSQDKKLRALVQLMKKDAVISKHKVLIFTEYMSTARYLEEQLKAEGFDSVEEIDSSSTHDRGAVIRRFAPYYNGTSSGELAENGKDEIRILVSTDVLSEGLNLQDCTRLINYDLHWNPVRLMQRIGRIDRRMSPDIEAQIITDHPDQKKLRGEVGYWNFLPPDDLEQLLNLYKRVANKTLRISKTFGIEGKKLLKPEDAYDDLRDFMEKYEGDITPTEKISLDLQSLLSEHPNLEAQLKGMPMRVFSGKEYPGRAARAVFFCYARPAHDETASKEFETDVWTTEAGDVVWYLYDLEKKQVLEDAPRIAAVIQCQPDTPRVLAITQETLADVRKKVEKHLKDTYLKRVQAPLGVKPILKCWMELN